MKVISQMAQKINFQKVNSSEWFYAQTILPILHKVDTKEWH